LRNDTGHFKQTIRGEEMLSRVPCAGLVNWGALEHHLWNAGRAQCSAPPAMSQSGFPGACCRSPQASDRCPQESMCTSLSRISSASIFGSGMD